MNRNRLKLIVLGVVILAAGLVIFVLRSDDSSLPDQGGSTGNGNQQSMQSGSQEGFKSMYSIDDPASLWVIVNKKRPLPSTYQPGDLKIVSGINLAPEAAAATEALIDGARSADVKLRGISGFRSYSSQQTVYNGYVHRNGQEEADTFSARPGHSEHQTGLAADIGNSDGTCDLDVCFAETAGGKWLAAHAHEYGFTFSYPDGKTSVTGYQYEPWHIRYVGRELAAELQKSGQTMQEFFGLPAAPSY